MHLQFSAEPDWLSNNAISGTIHNGNSVKVTLTFNSDDYPLGDYSMDMVVKSNDPSDSVLTIPIKMTIKSPMQLNLTAFIEGFYNGASMISDSVKIELRSSVSPYNLVESKAMILNSSGNGNCTFAAPTESTPYYLVLKHRNSIETWSALPQIFHIRFIEL